MKAELTYSVARHAWSLLVRTETGKAAGILLDLQRRSWWNIVALWRAHMATRRIGKAIAFTLNVDRRHVRKAIGAQLKGMEPR